MKASLAWQLSFVAIVAILLPVGFAGCGGNSNPPAGDDGAPTTDATPTVDSADSEADNSPDGELPSDGQVEDDSGAISDPTPALADQPAGTADSFAFETKFETSADELIGQTWRVSGFLKPGGTKFRKETWGVSKVNIEFANPPAASEMHACRELTIKGVVQKNEQGEPVLVSAVIEKMGADPETIIYTAEEITSLFSENPAYNELRFDNGDYKNPYMFQIRGRVFNIDTSTRGVYFYTNEKRVVRLQCPGEFVDSPDFAQVQRGQDTIFRAKWGARNDAQRPSLVRLEQAMPIDEKEQPKTEPEFDFMTKMTADEMVLAVEEDSQSFYEKYVVYDIDDTGKLPNEAGVGKNFLLTPFLVSGTIAKTTSFGTDSVFLNVGEKKQLQFMLTKDQSIEGLKAGDKISIVGAYQFFGLNASSKAFSLTSARIWKEKTPLNTPNN